MKKRYFWEAVATLIGCTLGAGIFGIPYVVAKAGLLTGIITIIILAAATLLINLYTGEIVLRTKEQHQLPGYAEKYLGKPGKIIMTISLIFGLYAALTAYIIGEGIALNAIFGWSAMGFSIIIVAIVAMLILCGIKAIEKSELFLAGLGLITFLGIITWIFFSGKINIANATPVNPYLILIPYGVVFFAFRGLIAIPLMREELGAQRVDLKKAIITGVLICAAVYLLFAIAVVLATGTNTSEVATVNLGILMGEKMLILGNILALLAMTTSFIGLGFALKEVYIYDYKITASTAWLLTIAIPTALFLLGADSFVNLLGIGGAISGGLEGILIVLMLRQAKKKSEREPEYKIKQNKIIDWILIIMFAAGAAYVIWGLF